MVEAYSPLRYPGGKARLSRFLIEVIRANGLSQPHYVEPFAGGAGAALRLLFEEFVDSITINDADPRIRCFWEAATRYPDRFLDRLEKIPVTIAEWRKQRELYKRRDLRKVFELGFATFFLNRTARSGIVHNGGPIGGFDQAGNYKIDARFNRSELGRRICRIAAYSDRIEISDHDGLALLRKLNRRRTAPKTLVYIDPPYYSKGNKLYFNRQTHSDHAAIAAYLSSEKRFKWLMTYDDVTEIRALYAGLPQIQFSLSYSAYKRRNGNELLIHPPSLRVPLSVRSALPTVAA